VRSTRTPTTTSTQTLTQTTTSTTLRTPTPKTALAVRTTALPDNRKPARGPQTSRQKTSAAQRAAALKRKHDAAEKRRRFIIVGTVVILVVVLAGVFTYIASSGSSTKTPASTTVAAGTLGAEEIPFESGTPLAGLPASVTGQTLNGVQCGSTEQLAYHIHARLTIYDNGVLAPVPAGLGIIQPVITGTGSQAFVGSATKCFYWLHTHAQDGVLHVESPTTKLYPLSDVFAIWAQPLSSTEVGPDKGTVTAYVNGKVYTGDPQNITLSSHEDIQLDVGTVVPPVTIDWSKSGL
jgi:hypothetical protein